MQLKRLLKGLNIEKINGSRNVSIQGVSSHSKEVKKGYIFVALRGSFRDGHDFIPEAIKRGAVAVVTQEDSKLPLNLPVCHRSNGGQAGGITYIRVRDTQETLAKIADNFYGNPTYQMKVIGITGTNGKTTVSYLMEDILKIHSFKTGRIGTIDYSWGERTIPSFLTTPPPLSLSELFNKMREDRIKAVVMEVSSHSLAQRRVDAVQFDSCVFTNISRDHLDYHPTLLHYISSKRRLVELLASSSKKNKFLVMNGDDRILRKFSNARPVRNKFLNGSSLPCIFYGLKPTNDVYAENVKFNRDGMQFYLSSPWYKGKVEVPLFGNFNLYNILAGISWAGVEGLDINKVIESLKKAKQVIGRFHVIKKNGVAAIIDYAHSPDALKEVIKAARELAKGRLITVFGCGGDRDKGKRPLMGKISSEESDYTIVTSDNPRSEDPLMIIEDIKKGLMGGNWSIEDDREKAIKHGIKMLKNGDILLIAGKGHENYQLLKDTVVPFSDIEIIKEYFGVD